VNNVIADLLDIKDKQNQMNENHKSLVLLVGQIFMKIEKKASFLDIVEPAQPDVSEVMKATLSNAPNSQKKTLNPHHISVFQEDPQCIKNEDQVTFLDLSRAKILYPPRLNISDVSKDAFYVCVYLDY
jgi:hypothetical protein